MAKLITQAGVLKRLVPDGPAWTPEDIADHVGSRPALVRFTRHTVSWHLFTGSEAVQQGKSWNSVASMACGRMVHGDCVLLKAEESFAPAT